MSFEITHDCAADWRERTVGGALAEGTRPGRRTTADAPSPRSAPTIAHYDLAVRRASEQWTKIRWSLFAFPDITDVAPTDDPDIVRVFYEGRRPYPSVWRVELLQAGFDVPALDTAQPSGAPRAPARGRQLDAQADRAAGARGPTAIDANGHGSNGPG